MFISDITPEGLAQEIVCRMLDNRVVALNNIPKAFRDMPAIQRVMIVLLKLGPGQLITQQDLNSAMTELFSAYNRNTNDNPILNPAKNEAAKIANYVSVSMVNDAIFSGVRPVAFEWFIAKLTPFLHLQFRRPRFSASAA